MASKKRPMLILALVIAGLQVPLANAQSLPELKAKSDPQPYARLHEAAKVSAARIIVGVVLDMQPVGLHPKMIARLPKAWVGESVCARLLSPDALFEAVAEYDVEDSAAGKTTVLGLTFNADDLRTIQEREMDQLALSVSRGGCQSAPEEFAMSMTNQRIEDAYEALTVFVNSQNAARVTVEVRSSDGGSNTIRCQRSNEPSRVGFDHLCSLPLDLFPTEEKTELRISRRDRFGGIEQPTRVIVSPIGSSN